MIETKTQAIEVFGGVPNLAAALDVSRQAIYQWPETLDQKTVDRVVGAAVRLGRLQAPADSQVAA
jgi:DNA-binding transcriptional regulator Cro